jgi:hypothetical protein
MALAVLYGSECATAFEKLSRAVRALQATRRELQRYAQSSSTAAAAARGTNKSTSASSRDNAMLDLPGPESNNGARRALGDDDNDNADDDDDDDDDEDNDNHSTNCYGCTMAYLADALLPLQQLTRHEPTRRLMIEQGVIDELVDW